MRSQRRKGAKHPQDSRQGERGCRLDSDARKNRRRRNAPTGSGESWFQARGPVFRFVLVFALLWGGFKVVFRFWVQDTPLFVSYLHLNAAAAAQALRLFGERADATGTSLFGDRFHLAIKTDCDAIQASAFFLFLVLAWPLSAARWRRLPAIAVGVTLLSMLNLVRIVSLYYTGVYFPNAFDTMHLGIWQALFIFVPLTLWLAWVRRAQGAAAGESNAG